MPSKRKIRTLGIAACATLLAVLAASLYAQSTKPPMKQFVLIFHRSGKPLSDADSKLLTERVRPWAIGENQAGHKLDPRILGSESAHLGPDHKSGDGPTALLFIEAADLEDPVKVAKGHPGLDFGASIDVRPWAPPAAPPK